MNTNSKTNLSVILKAAAGVVVTTGTLLGCNGSDSPAPVVINASNISQATPTPTPQATPDKYFLYIGNYTTSDAATPTYSINTKTGQLTLVENYTALNIGFNWVTSDSSGKYLFGANDNNVVYPFSIAQKTGTLTSGTSRSIGATPQTLTIDPSGSHVYVPNEGSDSISVFTVGNNGALAPLQTINDATNTGPNQISMTANGKFAYVANGSGNTVSVYTVASDTGQLTFTEAKTVPTSSASPLRVVTSKNSKFVYVANNGDSGNLFSMGGRDFRGSISVYEITNSTTGALTARQEVAADYYPRSIVIEPSGKFLYLVNTGSRNIQTYSINQTNGTLTATNSMISAAGVDVGGGLGWLNEIYPDPTGSFLYGVGTATDTLGNAYAFVSGYTINSSTGALTLIESHTEGFDPSQANPTSIAISKVTQ